MSSSPDDVYSVSDITARIKATLEADFASVQVCGEISDLSRPRSGHIYFTLKDENAQVRGVMWRSAAARLRYEPEDGMEVLCRGNIDVYPPRGSYQLVVRSMQPVGEGALQQALNRLREKLAKEGLFEPARKKPLPTFPRRVAFVTSPTGAALRDFLEVARRRNTGVDVMVIPARVQGDSAAAEIAAGIVIANRLSTPPDILVVGRGGGSVEDLWCFNEEPLVRAIAASEIPVVSAVGHEIDVTLADLAADVRALTPSEAAELVMPDTTELTNQLGNLGKRLSGALRGMATDARSRLEAQSRSRIFRQPKELIHDRARKVDELEVRANRLIARSITNSRQRLESAAAHLQALSPLAVLSRGYSITTTEDDKVIRSPDDTQPGERIVTRVAQGKIISRVEE